MIIASMLPATRTESIEPPYHGIARFVTAGKPSPLPSQIDALHGLDVSRAVWRSIGDLQSDPNSCVQLLEQVAAVQSTTGRILPATSDDHPESVWYFELQLTHAFATAGLLLKHEPFIAVASRASTFILNEIQPDHATNRPWALNAFLLSQDTIPLADWILHSTTVHLTTAPDPIALLLLEDCLYSLPS